MGITNHCCSSNNDYYATFMPSLSSSPTLNHCQIGIELYSYIYTTNHYSTMIIPLMYHHYTDLMFIHIIYIYILLYIYIYHQ